MLVIPSTDLADRRGRVSWLPRRRTQDAPERWNIHFQATSIGQHHGYFHSPYEGENSLPSHAESRVSLTATVFLTYRVNSWTELVVNPEMAGGKGFGQVTGLRASPTARSRA